MIGDSAAEEPQPGPSRGAGGRAGGALADSESEDSEEDDILSTAGSISGLRRAALREGVPLTGTKSNYLHTIPRIGTVP